MLPGQPYRQATQEHVRDPCGVWRYPPAPSAYHRVVVSKIRPSRKASSFTESVIREMTRLSVAHSAINLSQGFPDFPAPQEIKEAARDAITADINQYPITWGAEPFREAIARTYRDRYGMSWVDPQRDVT